jgi:prepilin-type N-terminal cleavage/methylation domain-containing protein
MKNRAGLTLVEVLVAIFIMGIGILAILSLFPLGLLNCRQALQDDRAARCAANAAAVANAWDLRYPNNPVLATALATNPTGVYVDPWYAGIPGQAMIPGSTIPRVGVPGWPGNPQQWVSLTDDYTWTPDGIPDAAPAAGTASSIVKNGGTYTWCYMLRRTLSQPANPNFTDMSVVVYKNRDLQTPGGETLFTAAGAAGTTAITLTTTAGQNPPIRKTGWILDPATAQFYRVVSIVEITPTTFILETQLPLKAGVASVIVMENVVEVFEKGYGWPP